MAYLVFSAKGQELGKRPLAGPMVIGRSPECDISVRDILLSRRHCQLEPTPEGWVIADLGSKNGTFVFGQTVSRHVLRDGDMVQLGQTQVTFRAGKMSGAAADPKQPIGVRRPTDPWEALSGTVSGFDFAKSHRIDVQRTARKTPRPLSSFPKPQPNPADPAAYAKDDLYSMLTDIAVSSWDSVYDDASRQMVKRRMPRPVIHPNASTAAVMTPQREVLHKTTQDLLKKTDQRVRRQRLGGFFSRLLRGVASASQWLWLLGTLPRKS